VVIPKMGCVYYIGYLRCYKYRNDHQKNKKRKYVYILDFIEVPVPSHESEWSCSCV
jgi:hypothetical protein